MVPVNQPLGQHAAGNSGGPPFALEEGDRMLRVRLDGGEMYAKQGSMVAYRGKVDFAYKGQGVGGYLRRAVTGEGQDLMRIKGRGTVWFAESGSHISIFHLDNDRLTVNGRSLLALESGVRYKITTTSGGIGAMIAGGVFNTEVSGTGGVGVLCLGSPLVLPTDEPVCVDRDAAVAWTAGVRTRVVSSFKVGNLIGRTSGELAQIEYSGRGGFVVVQCGEIPARGAEPSS
ncbi:AIM24 family protein [Parafrankia discariae]|uniref:AIM24 family protein n=1 Tax=Parafrankia discariae TaxID=365528 RepID=UPI000475A09B|nr:AIM24 family protein [Parafrankia discariae]